MKGFLFLLSMVRRTLGGCPGSNVVTLPYGNVTVLDASVRRGIPIDLGTPPQPVAMVAAGYANNTFLWDDTHGCDVREQYDQSCIVGRGGIFWVNKSSTWSDIAKPNITAQDTTMQGFGFTGTPPRGADILHLNDSYSLYDFPVATTKGGITMNSLGLGRDSTFLQTLVKKGAIISKTWSLFYGLTGADEDAQMDGTAVFGGYDQAKTKGDNQTFRLNYDVDCRTGMVATITSIDVGFDNGTEQNAFASQINMCLDPSFEILSFTPSIVNTLKTKFGGKSFGTSTGRAHNGLLYNTEDAFTGNISVTLNRKLKITVPNKQLVVPDYVVLGNETVFSDTSREVLVGVPTGGDQPEWMTYLGQPFFTAAYLMVNHDLGTFSVWQSNPTYDEDYHAIDSTGSVCKEEVNAPTTSSNTTVSPAISDFPHQGQVLSTGVIVGIVVGAVGVVAFIAAFLAMFFYRRRVRKLKATQKQSPQLLFPVVPKNEYRNQFPVEAPSSGPEPTEVPGDFRQPSMAFELPTRPSSRRTPS
ncbi:aspartic peptidase domain-containing protein [Aspergillus leporis]|uniref:Aspartic peptidase domain-containing protein n=1 Tax=Aspergillus leporis TaxID=41062 RepID=A0A5N5WJB7_9EURO|nr:aspartic peptidase domain-containing protein [Aspergillus leporis]